MHSQVWIFAIVCLLGCSCKAPPATADDRLQRGKFRQDDQQDAAMGKGEIMGMVTVRGIFHHSKGDMGEVNGMIIGPAELRGDARGGWKPEYEALVGKQVEARGQHYRYECGPIEQCLEGGVIHYLQALEYLRLAE